MIGALVVGLRPLRRVAVFYGAYEEFSPDDRPRIAGLEENSRDEAPLHSR